MNECLKFLLFYILNLPTLVILTPPHLPYTPSIECVNSSIDYDNSYVNCGNTFTDYINTSIDCANKYDDCVNTSDDYVNTFVDSTNTPNKLTSKFYILESSFL
jgi:hypothetical protein